MFSSTTCTSRTNELDIKILVIERSCGCDPFSSITSKTVLFTSSTSSIMCSPCPPSFTTSSISSLMEFSRTTTLDACITTSSSISISMEVDIGTLASSFSFSLSIFPP
ncbi:hypothetical protein MANES_01G049525v8 [Manihot esculenta]|uniref:Uncharacterized protein n=1 Tax=Manihot esculenta TaxID=3983 RepID=A0ACB7IC38_MANES|nr:hypothetical protein MANES_01G049525v8 [Manihot esculenta]